MTTKAPLPQLTPACARGKLTDDLFTDPLWFAEEKLDGIRELAHFTPEGVRFTGRRISKVDGLFVEKTDNLPHLNYGSPEALNGTVLDGEIIDPRPGARSRDVTPIMGSAPDVATAKQQETGFLHYRVFDCMFDCGVDVRAEPLAKRRLRASMIVCEWAEYRREDLPLVDMVRGVLRDDRRAFLERIWAEGGEGIILKRIDAAYGDEKAWVKVKAEATFDVVVNGFEAPKATSTKVDGTTSVTKLAAEGLIGAVKILQVHAVPDGNPRWLDCGTVSGMDDATRRDMTEHPEKYNGHVMEITAQLQEPSGKFRHPRFSRMRPDKNPHDCVFETS